LPVQATITLRPQRRQRNRPASNPDPALHARPITEMSVIGHHLLDLFKLFQLM
jgi:hypothetical protein